MSVYPCVQLWGESIYRVTPVLGALVEYAVILYRKQKAHHYMSPSYSPSYQGTYSFTSYNSMAENGEDYREEKYGKNIHTCKASSIFSTPGSH